MKKIAALLTLLLCSLQTAFCDETKDQGHSTFLKPDAPESKENTPVKKTEQPPPRRSFIFYAGREATKYAGGFVGTSLGGLVGAGVGTIVWIERISVTKKDSSFENFIYGGFALGAVFGGAGGIKIGGLFWHDTGTYWRTTLGMIVGVPAGMGIYWLQKNKYHSTDEDALGGFLISPVFGVLAYDLLRPSPTQTTTVSIAPEFTKRGFMLGPAFHTSF